MRLLDRIGQAFGRKAKELTYDQLAALIDGANGGSVAGVHVTERTALQVSTVLACVKVIADGCAAPDLHVYREGPAGQRERALNIPEYRLLARRPNEWQTSFEWRRMMTLHAALTGAALSIKVRGDNRRVRELIPVEPGRWEVRRVSRYELRYRCWDEFGMIGEFGADDVFVLNALQWNWVGALNAVHLAANAVGLAMATERSQASMHANGVRPSGVYTVDGTLSAEQHDRLAAWIAARHGGPEKSGGALVLDRNAKWMQTAMTSVDAQHIETRRQQVEEVCRAYGVFPIMVGHSDKSATFASSEAFFSAHLKHTLTPWHRAWQQRIDEMLLDGSGPLFAQFDTRYLTAGSMVDRGNWARAMTEMGIYTRNELRDEEGLDPLPGLDQPLTPMNMGGGGSANAPKQADLQELEQRLQRLAETRAAEPPKVEVRLSTEALELQLRQVVAAAVEGIRANTQATADKIKAIGEAMPIHITVPPAAAPVVQVTNEVPVPAVEVHATMPDTMRMEIQSMPARTTSSSVERDQAGNIVRTTQTERDA